MYIFFYLVNIDEDSRNDYIKKKIAKYLQFIAQNRLD